MADFTTHLKSAAWTEVEVGAVVVGSIAASTMLDTRKIFKKAFVQNPMWFEGPRIGAPFHIRHFGLIKAGGAVLASTYVQNSWIKLLLMGVALQGTLEEARVLSWDDKNQNYRFDKIGAGDTAKLDAELKKLAEQYRTRGPQFEGGHVFTGKADVPYAERYESQVAFTDRDPLANRYESQVAKAMIYDDSEMDGPFSFGTSDNSGAY